MSNSKGYAIVTGGGSGIGRAFCATMAQHGWHVAVVDVDEPAALETVAQITNAGGSAEARCFDVADADAWETFCDELRTRWPRLDLLVNCAGMMAAGDVAALDVGSQRRIVEVNLLGTLWSCRTMTPWLQASAGPQLNAPVPPGIINAASIFATLSPPGFAAYSASKAGVVALSESLRGELRSHGLNVTVVLPGVVPTSLFSRAIYADERIAALARRYATESRLQPEAVVQAALNAHRHGKLYAVVGGRARVFWRCKQFFPRRLIDLIARRTARELKETPCSI